VTFGLVLGAGGSAGEAFHRGVVRALQDIGRDPRSADVLVGTSAGSVVAASLRRHAPAASGTAFEPVPRRAGPSRSALLDLSLRPRQALNALLLRSELTTGRQSLRLVQEGLRGEHRRWPPAALWIVAVERATGRRVVFGRRGEPVADVGSAVAASCAIPGVFRAVQIDGRAYVDGGAHSPTNADVLAGSGLDVVVVSSPMSMTVRSSARRLDAPARLLFQAQLRAEVWTLRRRGLQVVTVAPDAAVLDALPLNMMDGRNRREIEERAYQLARRRLRPVQLPDAAHR
jgi:NTE family protein